MQAELDEQTRELIAIGAAIGAHCQPCLIYHLSKAKELGIEGGLIRAAMEEAQLVEQGAMAAMQELAKRFLKTLPPDGAAGDAK